VIGWSWHGRHEARQRHPNKPVDDLNFDYRRGREKKDKETEAAHEYSRWTL